MVLKRMYGDGEAKRKPANPGSPERITGKMLMLVCVCVLV